MSLSLGMLPKSLCDKKLAAVLAILVCFVCLPAAFGQIAAEPAGSDQAIQPPQDFTPQELWHDALHYFKIGRFSYGKAYLQAFLDAKANPSVALELSEKEPRDVEVLTKLTTNPDLQEVVTKALELIDTGWELRRRDPSYVSKELDRLDRGARARFHAVDRLKQSGQYAVPVMVRYLQDPARQALYAQIVESLFALGKAGVAPSLAALEGASPPTKAMLVRVLGRWAYPQALPYLKQLADSTADAQLRSDCQAAISKIAALNPRYAPDTPAARMFYDLAERHYQQDSALAPDPRTERPNLWYWHESQGLVYVPVPKDIYFELMAMRCARGALKLDKDMAEAVGLWLSANFRREAKLPPGDNDPVHPEDFPTAVYFARCAGPQYNLMVLAGALKLTSQWWP